MAEDNCVCALFSVLAGNPQFSSSPTGSQLWNLVFEHIPLKTDTEQGRWVNGELLKFVMQNNRPDIFTQPERTGKVCSILAECYKSESSDADFDKELKQMFMGLNRDLLLGMKPTFKTTNWTKVEKILGS